MSSRVGGRSCLGSEEGRFGASTGSIRRKSWRRGLDFDARATQGLTSSRLIRYRDTRDLGEESCQSHRKLWPQFAWMSRTGHGVQTDRNCELWRSRPDAFASRQSYPAIGHVLDARDGATEELRSDEALSGHCFGGSRSTTNPHLPWMQPKSSPQQGKSGTVLFYGDESILTIDMCLEMFD